MNDQQLGVIDTSDDSGSEIQAERDDVGTGGGYIGGCVGKDGKVYFFPYDTAQTQSILVVDPIDDSTEVFGDTESGSWISSSSFRR